MAIDRIRKRLKSIDEFVLGRHRRKFIATVATGAAAVLTLVAVEGYRWNKAELQKAKSHQAIYGLLQNPTYVLVSPPPNSFPTIKEELLQKYPEYRTIQERSSELDNLEEKLNFYRRELPAAKREHDEQKSKDTTPTVNRIRNYLEGKVEPDKYKKLLRDLESDIANLEHLPRIFNIQVGMSFGRTKELNEQILTNLLERKSLREQEPNYGDLIGLGNRVFIDLTGKNLPPNLQSAINDIKEKDTAGWHKFGTETVNVKDLGYEKSLNTYLHELGHVCYQGQESFWHDSLRLNSLGSIREMEIMEQAAAYLFMAVGIEKVAELYPDLGERMRIVAFVDRLSQIKEYKEGDKDEHPCGWALAEALANHFNGDYAKSFNFISTRNQFSQLPEGVISTYESFRRSIPYDGIDMESERTRILGRTTAIKQLYGELLKTYEPPQEEKRKPLIDWGNN